MKLHANRFIVTGGASGLGAATARALAQAGSSVVLVDRDAARGALVVDSIGAAAELAVADITSEQQFGDVVDRAASLSGGLAGVVHCAGVARPELVLGRDGPQALDSFRRIVEVNLVGTFNVVRLAASALAERKPDSAGERGVLVLTSSIAAFDGQAGQAAYSAAKGGVASLTLPLARELGRHGIRVVSIAPGLFGTEMLGELRDDVRRSLESQVPFPHRLGRPEEYAALVLHAIENQMLNGETIRLDGGLRLGPR